MGDSSQRRGTPTWLVILLGLLVGAGLTVGGYLLYQSGRNAALPEVTIASETTVADDADATDVDDGDGERVIVIDETDPDATSPDDTDGGGGVIEDSTLYGTVVDEADPPDDDGALLVFPPVATESSAGWNTVLTLRCRPGVERADRGRVRLPAGRYRFVIEVTRGGGNDLSALYSVDTGLVTTGAFIWSTDNARTGTGVKTDPVDLHSGTYAFSLRQSGTASSDFTMRVQRWEQP